MTDVQEFQRYIPEGYERPTTPLQALKVAREILAEEGRWVQAEWFTNKNPELDPEDAFCNSWRVCAAGAIGICTIGNHKVNLTGSVWNSEARTFEIVLYMAWKFDEGVYEFDDDRKLYVATRNALLEHVPDGVSVEYDDDDNEYEARCQWESVPEWNDHNGTTRTGVLDAFDKAIEALEWEQANV